jgi:hypothetical protein
MKMKKSETIDGKMGYWERGAFIGMPPMYQYPPLTLENVNGRLSRIEKILMNELTYHADINVKSESEIIVVGYLNGHDYVKQFFVHPDRLPDIVKILNDIGCVCQQGRVDFPPPFRWNYVFRGNPKMNVEEGFR